MSRGLGPILVVGALLQHLVGRKLHESVSTQARPVWTAKAGPRPASRSLWSDLCASLEFSLLASCAEKGWVAVLEVLGLEDVANNSNSPNLLPFWSVSNLVEFGHWADSSGRGCNVYRYTSPSS